MKYDEYNKLVNDTVELASIQDVIGAIELRLKMYRTEYPYATVEIDDMETVLHVLDDLIMDMGD